MIGQVHNSYIQNLLEAFASLGEISNAVKQGPHGLGSESVEFQVTG